MSFINFIIFSIKIKKNGTLSIRFLIDYSQDEICKNVQRVF